ncbi:AAA family ATPase [Candidatus Wolfebacteria bacterium]|nr:AAA family ATPase [Candidatus Wolfebacteria bacterium]
MFLKSLELNGFKSFAQKTVLEFPVGITAIVGPNGSGKSNIIDAIRWLLGEREAKNLRGAKAEDLIFNGTPKRPRVGMAGASLHFDNGSGFFPVDFKEVSISRQLSRDGNSQYFLNKSEVRLKDIIDFFSRSRLGTKGLAIINQGNSDLFVRVSPEERRVMIEEVLGLREYQIKKSEAERKLKSTGLNLEKVKAMIDEVAPRLRLLKRQTGKLEKRSEVEKELKKLEDGYFSFRLKEINKNKIQLEPDLVFVKKRINEKEKELKILEDDLEKVNLSNGKPAELKSVKDLRNNLLEKRSLIQKELGRLEAKIEFLSVQKGAEEYGVDELLDLIKNLKHSLEEGLNLEPVHFRKKAEELIVEINGFLNRSGKSKKEEPPVFLKIKNELTGQFAEIEKELKELEKKETFAVAELEKFNERFRGAFESMEAKKEELRELENKKNRIIFEEEKLNLKLQDLEKQFVQIGRSFAEFQSAGKFEEAEFPHIENDGEVEKKMFKLRTELAAIGEIDENLIKEAEEVENHYNFLTTQSVDLEKASVDLKNLIGDLSGKIHVEFDRSLKLINEEFNNYFKLMFGGGQAKLKLKIQSAGWREKIKSDEMIEEMEDKRQENPEEQEELKTGVEIELSLPKKRVSGLDMLSGGEKTLVSIAALFALISVSPPPFLVLDEIDAALDENNSKRFAGLIGEFSKKTQFIIVTHNRSTMEAADILYGITVAEDGTSKVLSLKLESKI